MSCFLNYLKSSVVFKNAVIAGVYLMLFAGVYALEKVNNGGEKHEIGRGVITFCFVRGKGVIAGVANIRLNSGKLIRSRIGSCEVDANVDVSYTEGLLESTSYYEAERI
ncbi:hypothetical protein NBRC116583_38480 [Arenicella sp. 4NH20-0111]